MEGDASADRRNDEPTPLPGADAATRCSLSTQSFDDPITGITWTPVWYCGNRGGAPIFETASARTQIGRMRTTMSWFACYRHGDPHTGGNDVWYYTQGDETLPGWESRHAWGYMAAVDVYTSIDPFPGIGECP
jgi:hypothetical protein